MILLRVCAGMSVLWSPCGGRGTTCRNQGGSLLLLCGPWGLNSGFQGWWQKLCGGVNEMSPVSLGEGAFDDLDPSWIRRCSLAGGGMSWGQALKKTYAVPNCSPPPVCSSRCELSAVPGTMVDSNPLEA